MIVSISLASISISLWTRIAALILSSPNAVVVARMIFLLESERTAVILEALFLIATIAACAIAVYALGSFLITAMLDADARQGR